MPAGADVMRAVSTILFAVLGYLLSAKLPAPRKVLWWGVFIAGIWFVNYVMVSTLLIGVFGEGIYLNNALQGLGLGILFGFIVRGKAQVA